MLSEKEIIELLTEENLSETQKKALLKEFWNNNDFKDLKHIIDSLDKLAEKDHIDTDTISEYILYIGGDKSFESKLITFIPGIEKHLQHCSNCREKFKMLSSELNEIDAYISENIISEVKSSSIHTQKRNIWDRYFNSQIKYSYAIAASIVFLTLTLFTVSEITTPNYVKLSSDMNELDFSTTRGRSSESFINAVNALDNNNYEDAIKLMHVDISENKDDITIFYTYYILGITHLAKANTNFLGLFDSYNKAELNQANINFQKVLELNNSGLFQNLNYNSYFYLGQTYLLIEDFASAKEYLNLAINNRSEYSDKAAELLSAIE